MSTMLPPGKENQFSFSDRNSTEGTTMEYDEWAEKIKGKYNRFGRPEDVKSGAWTRKAKPEDDVARTPSPELWRGGRTDAVRSAGCSPVRRCENHETSQISNNPRALTIAKYRQEMLDLARDMPESGYELSLIDIVETPRTTEAIPKEKVENNLVDNKNKKEKKKKKKKGTISRSESLDHTGGPLLIKMFSPIMPAAFGGRKQSFGNSPGGDKRREGEWWSKEFGEMVSSTSSSSSSGSSGSSGSRNSRILRSCYPFLSHKDKSMGTEE